MDTQSYFFFQNMIYHMIESWMDVPPTLWGHSVASRYLCVIEKKRKGVQTEPTSLNDFLL